MLFVILCRPVLSSPFPHLNCWLQELKLKEQNRSKCQYGLLSPWGWCTTTAFVLIEGPTELNGFYSSCFSICPGAGAYLQQSSLSLTGKDTPRDKLVGRNLNKKYGFLYQHLISDIDEPIRNEYECIIAITITSVAS